jgi:hypothetical protein
VKFNSESRLARSVGSLVCLGALIGVAAWSPAQFEREASAHAGLAQVELDPREVADQFSWTYSPALVTPDRWTNPRLALSTDGDVSAVWEQKITDDTSQVMASILDAGTWTIPEPLGIMAPSTALLRTWSDSARLTLSWLTQSVLEGKPTPAGWNDVTIKRQSQTGAWESVLVREAFRPTTWRDIGPRLQVRTLANDSTVAVFQNKDDTPVIANWPAGVERGELRPEVTSGWLDTARIHWTEFAISPAGDVFAFVLAANGLEVRELVGTTWKTDVVVQDVANFRPVPEASASPSRRPGQLQIGTDNSEVVVAWQQMDFKYGEDYQVWTATVRDGAVLSKSLMYEHVRPGTWTNQQPRISMNVAADGTRCLTYPTPPYGTLQGVRGNSGGWGEPVLTDITLAPFTADVVARFTELSASSMGCLHDGLYGWFNDTEAARIPQPAWTLPGAGTMSALANSAVAAELAGAGTNQLQVALLDRSIPPVVTAPGPVTKLTSKPQRASVRFSWKPPADFGGASRVTYQWRVGKAKWSSTSALSVVVPAERGKTVVLQVRAVNSAGAGSVARATGRGR